MDTADFVRDGYLRIERPDMRRAAAAARSLLWQQVGLSPDDPGGWTEPVVWATDATGQGPFGELARSPRLARVLDDVCGAGGWRPRGTLGNIPVRLPGPPAADDRGWHLDLNTPQPDGSWAVSGRPHTVLVLTLLSDVGPDDAPTRIRVRSHRAVAAVLDERPRSAGSAAALVDRATAELPVAHATGQAGDVCLLHPFTVHAADEHRGTAPRFMAQAPVLLTRPLAPAQPSALAAVWH